MPQINYLAVLVAGISAMVIGGLWYGPLFGKLWMQGMGWNPDDQELMAKMKKGAGVAYFQQFIGALLMAYTLAHMLWAYSLAIPAAVGFSAGLQSGFWVWLGFILPVKYGDKLWSGKKLKYVAIDLGSYLVTLLVMGVILAWWK